MFDNHICFCTSTLHDQFWSSKQCTCTAMRSCKCVTNFKRNNYHTIALEQDELNKAKAAGMNCSTVDELKIVNQQEEYARQIQIAENAVAASILECKQEDSFDVNCKSTVGKMMAVVVAKAMKNPNFSSTYL